MEKIVMLAFVLAFPGCAVYSPLSYDQTIAAVRNKCEIDANEDRSGHVGEKEVFGIHEDGSDNCDHWAISFVEGRAWHKQDVILPKRTTISVSRRKDGRATYDVRCDNQGFYLKSRDKEREKYWREQLWK